MAATLEKKLEDEISEDIKSSTKKLTKDDVMNHMNVKKNRPNKKNRAKKDSKKFREEDSKTFTTIKEFVEELEECFGKMEEISNFSKVISETKSKNKAAILFINGIFTKFCNANKDAITSKDHTKLKGKVEFSTNSFIDFKKVFSSSDDDTKETIWRWLLTIYNIFTSDEDAKSVVEALLKSDGKKGGIKDDSSMKNASSESKLVTGLMEDMVNTIEPSDGDDIEATISNIMKSGFINKVINKVGSGEKDGSIDPRKLLGTIQSTISKLGAQI